MKAVPSEYNVVSRVSGKSEYRPTLGQTPGDTAMLHDRKGNSPHPPCCLFLFESIGDGGTWMIAAVLVYDMPPHLSASVLARA